MIPVVKPTVDKNPAISFFFPVTFSGLMMNKAVVMNPLVKANTAILKYAKSTVFKIGISATTGKMKVAKKMILAKFRAITEFGV